MKSRMTVDVAQLQLIMLRSHHGAAGDGDDRQGNGARRGDAAGLSYTLSRSHAMFGL